MINIKNRISHLFSFAVLLIFCSSFSTAICENKCRLDCSPSYVLIQSGIIESSTKQETDRFAVKAAIIGCRNDLGTIAETEFGIIGMAIREVVSEVHYNVLDKSQDQEIRRKIVLKINERIGRDIISDVLLLRVSIAEKVL